jgi:Protein kinase domain
VYKLHVSICCHCQATLRPGATFCGSCGAAQPSAEPSEPPLGVQLALDVSTLKHLALDERCLLRWRLENVGAAALEAGVLRLALSGTALPELEFGALGPAQAAVRSLAITPELAGLHQLTGELAVRGPGPRARGYRLAEVVVRVSGEGPQINLVHIDQSSARVVDNSRSSFGAGAAGGLVGDPQWQAIDLADLPTVAPTPTPATPPPAPVDLVVSTDRASYQLTSQLGRGDIAVVYGGHDRASAQPVAVKLVDQPSDNDLMQHEVRVLSLLLAKPHKAAHHLAPARDQFRTADGRMGTVFDQLDGLTLTQVRERCRARGEPGLSPQHVIWVLRRCLAALGWAHQNGILHGNLDPDHILVRPRDHMLWVVDWCWAVVNPAQTQQGWKARNEIYSPPEVQSRGSPTPASDLYALGKCAIYVVGGDPAAKTLPEMDPRLARLLRYLCVESQGGRAQSAWELYQQVERIREQIWGPHTFVPLTL